VVDWCANLQWADGNVPPWNSAFAHSNLTRQLALDLIVLLTIEDSWNVWVQSFPALRTSACEEYAATLEGHLAAARELADQVFNRAIVNGKDCWQSKELLNR
jgi:hypothetical protein